MSEISATSWPATDLGYVFLSSHSWLELYSGGQCSNFTGSHTEDYSRTSQTSMRETSRLCEDDNVEIVLSDAKQYFLTL